MIPFIRQVFLVFQKDLFAEFREAVHLVSVVLFGLVLLLLLSFAWSVEPDTMRKVASGLFWLTVFFSSVLTLGHSFRRETEEGQWEGLILLGCDPKAMYLGKMLANLFFLLALQTVLFPVMAVLYDLPLTGSVAVLLLLGSLGISGLGTFYAGLTATFKEGQVLLPVLLFPMLVPVLLSAVQATGYALVRDLFGQQTAWFKLLAVFDTIFLLASLWCADFLFDRA